MPLDSSAGEENGVIYRWRATVDDRDIDALHADAFGGGTGSCRWRRSRPLSLGWATASEGGHLIGFVNVTWDGNCHAFLLDTGVASDRQRRRIGRRVVAEALDEAHRAGCQWAHVDYEQHLSGFYAAGEFRRCAQWRFPFGHPDTSPENDLVNAGCRSPCDAGQSGGPLGCGPIVDQT